MATVYKRGEKWWGQWYLPGGKRVARATGTTKKRDAERIAAEMEAKDRKKAMSADDVVQRFRLVLERAAADAQGGKLDVGRAGEHLNSLMKAANPSFKVVSLADHLRDWSATAGERVSKSTAHGYDDMVRHFLLVFPPNVAKAPVGDLTPGQVETALGKIAKLPVKKTVRTLRASTANLDLRALRRAMAAAVRDKLAMSNPAADVRPLPESDSVERAPFTAAEVRAMIDHDKTPEEWKGAILIGAHTGLRLRDVVSIGRGHVEGTKLVIRPAKTKRSGKTVTVPLTPPCLAWIGEKPGDFFPKLKAMKTSTLSTLFSRIMKRAGVAATVTLPGEIVASRSFHSLRHSFASWLAEGDIHADVRQKLTGHSSAGVHAKYTHHDAALDRAIKVLPDFGRGPAEETPEDSAEEAAG